MTIRYEFCIIFGRKSSFPNKLSYEIPFSKHLIANLSQILNLIVINRDKNHAILS